MRDWLVRFNVSCATLALILAGCDPSRTAQERATLAHSLWAIGRAAETFQKDHGVSCWDTPVVGKAGLSWRVELLPYLEQENIYAALKKETDNFTIPLYAPDGTPAAASEQVRHLLGMPVFAYAHSNPPGTAPFRRVVKADRPNAFVVAETSEYTPWAKPGDDLAIEDGKPLPRLGGNLKGGFLALCADGKVRWISASLSKSATAAAMFDGKGGQVQ